MSHYETTVRLTHISTSTKGRSGLSVADAVGAAKANLRYITRDDAAQPGNIIARSNGAILDGSPADLKAAARSAIEARSERHTDAYGVRLADKLIVSLPRDSTLDEQRTMCAAILSDFTRDSEAFGMAAIHTDKRGNPHAHFLFVDGLESLDAAKARRPDAKRVRRADALRLNEGGNRQEVRERVAAAINATAAPAGRRLAEVRSLKDRGIDREPQQHEGPQVADRIARVPDKPTFTRRVMARLKATSPRCADASNATRTRAPASTPTICPSGTARAGWAPPCATGRGASASSAHGGRTAPAARWSMTALWPSSRTGPSKSRPPPPCPRS